MSDTIDTSADAVARLVAQLNGCEGYLLETLHGTLYEDTVSQAAATLSALLAERDEAVRLNGTPIGGLSDKCIRLRKERDDLRARLEKLRTDNDATERELCRVSEVACERGVQLSAAQARVAELEDDIRCRDADCGCNTKVTRLEAREKTLREALETERECLKALRPTLKNRPIWQAVSGDECIAKIAAALAQSPDANGSWLQQAEQRGYPEDADLENGNYANVCRACGKHFTGHKHRVFCKPCNEGTQPTAPDAQSPEQVIRDAAKLSSTWNPEQDGGAK